MKAEFYDPLINLNTALGTPVVPWSPETGYQKDCYYIDETDNKFELRRSYKNPKDWDILSSRLSRKEMVAFIKGYLAGVLLVQHQNKEP